MHRAALRVIMPSRTAIHHHSMSAKKMQHRLLPRSAVLFKAVLPDNITRVPRDSVQSHERYNVELRTALHSRVGCRRWQHEIATASAFVWLPEARGTSVNIVLVLKISIAPSAPARSRLELSAQRALLRANKESDKRCETLNGEEKAQMLHATGATSLLPAIAISKAWDDKSDTEVPQLPRANLELKGTLSMSRSRLISVIVCFLVSFALISYGNAQIADGSYSVATTVSSGILNMRSGPGLGHSLVVSIPAGAAGVSIAGCQSPDDGSSNFKWCHADWNGYSGWVSSCCLIQSAGQSLPNTSARPSSSLSARAQRWVEYCNREVDPVICPCMVWLPDEQRAGQCASDREQEQMSHIGR
jgi:uncharacterized protein YraI